MSLFFSPLLLMSTCVFVLVKSKVGTQLETFARNKTLATDKLKLTGQNLGRVFNSRLGRACIGHAIVHITKQPNLKLKTQPKQLSGSLLSAFTLHALAYLAEIKRKKFSNISFRSSSSSPLSHSSLSKLFSF
jgi:hypothetical protein